MIKNKNQNGIALIETLLIILILVIIGFGGYYVYHSQKQTKGTLNTATKTSASMPVSPYAGWKTYATKVDGLSFKYPSSWKFSNGAGQFTDVALVSVTSPSGTTVTLGDPLSGVGGACDPTTDPHIIVDKVTPLGISAKLPLYLVLMNYQGHKSLAVIDGDSSEFESQMLTKGDTHQCLIYPTFLSPKTTSDNPWMNLFSTGPATPRADENNKDILSDTAFMDQPDIKTAVLMFKSLKY